MDRKRILVIEDAIELAEMIRKYLANEQYSVSLLSNGSEALTMIGMLQPDMILLDLMLPGTDGLEILRQVRTVSMVPIIIISAKETELDRILGLKIGADDYMTKPFSMKEMVARVEALFRRTEANQPINNKKRFRFANISVDEVSRVVMREDKELYLTAKEFDLLICLLKHPRQVLSKEQLYHHVWGVHEYGENHTVTIHIQKIREKLGKDNGITTVRGAGYRFDGGIE
ncbi:response regulator transcription factor [Enterococcus sp. BWR-S5]|uniref:response regulator transcription factor n=1 Tax=Enterococcus sp. BWR-S5 TaxID=2787714 RepID=UPI0019246277|nr:response regulator transcription factor [Enterococcus sp. BWR-S5]MBL1225270.1 response regulator transcription factor [Enterococcus sp. BWR-S5]